MTEHQLQLQQLVTRRAAVIEEVNTLRAEAQAKAELVIRLEGAIEGLQLVGIELPPAEETIPVAEGEEAAEETEAAEWLTQ